MILLETWSNVNSSTNGLVNYTLSNSQSWATVMQKIDLGTSSQAHIGLLITWNNNASLASCIKLDKTSSNTSSFNIWINNVSPNWNWSYAMIYNNYVNNWTWSKYWIYFEDLATSSSSGNTYWLYLHSASDSIWTINNFIHLNTIPNKWAGIYMWITWQRVTTWKFINITSSISVTSTSYWRTTDYSSYDISRTWTITSWTLVDDYNCFNFKRTSVQNWTWWTFTAAWSVLKLENVATQTAGTLTDSVTPLLIVQDADSTGAPISVTQNAVVSTNFKKLMVLAWVTIWMSDGTTADGALSWTEGDICFNWGTGAGQAAYCDATGTNWTDM
jgi:hypothetical protein